MRLISSNKKSASFQIIAFPLYRIENGRVCRRDFSINNKYLGQESNLRLTAVVFIMRDYGYNSERGRKYRVKSENNGTSWDSNLKTTLYHAGKAHDDKHADVDSSIYLGIPADFLSFDSSSCVPMPGHSRNVRNYLLPPPESWQINVITWQLCNWIMCIETSQSLIHALI